MSRRAFPKIARIKYFRNNARFTTLILRIHQGTQSDIGKDVHLSLTKEDLPVLREVVKALEEKGKISG